MAAEAAKAEGNKALQAKNYDEAVKKYTEAIAFDATQHTYFSNRAAAYMQLKDYERALQDAESRIKLNPTWAKGYSRKGAALHAMKKYDQADAAYHEGLAVAPGDASLKQGVVDVNKAKGAQQSQQNNPMAQAFGPNLIAKIAQDPNLRHKLGETTHDQWSFTKQATACTARRPWWSSCCWASDPRYQPRTLALPGQGLGDRSVVA